MSPYTVAGIAFGVIIGALALAAVVDMVVEHFKRRRAVAKQYEAMREADARREQEEWEREQERLAAMTPAVQVVRRVPRRVEKAVEEVITRRREEAPGTPTDIFQLIGSSEPTTPVAAETPWEGAGGASGGGGASGSWEAAVAPVTPASESTYTSEPSPSCDSSPSFDASPSCSSDTGSTGGDS